MTRTFRSFAPALLVLCISCSSPVGRVVDRPEFDATARLLDLPGLPRGDSPYDCGPEALSAVMTFLGRSTSVAGVATRVRPDDRRGTLSSDLVLEAQRRGFDAIPLSGSLRAMKSAVDRGRPPILMVRVSPTRLHYFVVVGYSNRKQTVACLDYGHRLRLLDYEELEEIWGPTGHEMIQVRPGTARTQLNLGAVAERSGRWNEAVHHYRAALKLDAELVEARIGLGNGLRGLKDLEGSRAAYEKVLQRLPEQTTAMNNLADVLLELETEPERAEELAGKAVEAFRRDLQRHPEERATRIRLAFALGTLGEARMVRRKFDEALHLWQESLDLIPRELASSRVRRMNDLARACRALGDEDGAVEWSRRAAAMR